MFVFLGLLSGPHGLTCTQGCCLDKQCQQPVGCYFAPLSCSLFYYPGEIGIAVNNSVSCLVKHDALKREIYLKKNTTKQIQHPHPQILVVEVERKQFPPCLCSRHRGKRGRNLPGLLQAVLPQFFGGLCLSSTPRRIQEPSLCLLGPHRSPLEQHGDDLPVCSMLLLLSKLMSRGTAAARRNSFPAVLREKSAGLGPG